ETMYIHHPHPGDDIRHQSLAYQCVTYSQNIEIETGTSLCGLYTSVNPYKTLVVKVAKDGTTHIDITYDSDLKIKNTVITPVMNPYDMEQSMEVLNKMIDYRPNSPGWVYPRLYDKSPDEFLDRARRTESERLSQFVEKDKLFSKEF